MRVCVFLLEGWGGARDHMVLVQKLPYGDHMMVTQRWGVSCSCSYITQMGPGTQPLGTWVLGNSNYGTG